MTIVNENVHRLVAALDAAIRTWFPSSRWIDRGALVLAVAFLLAAVALGLIWTSPARATPHGRVSTPLLQQVRSQWRCLVTSTAKPKLHVCGANYTDVLLAVNAKRELRPVAIGVARASHRPVQACRCTAGQTLQKAQQVATFSRRRFRDWWANPKTPAGHKLKGCLKNAALALGAYYAVYVASGGKHWDDDEVMWGVGIACGIGAIVDA